MTIKRAIEHRLEPHERPRWVYEYYVTGTGEFPWDMLRYDACWPADSTEAYKMGVGFWGKDDAYSRRRSIKLRSYRAPTVDRWSSFTWSVGVEDLGSSK